MLSSIIKIIICKYILELFLVPLIIHKLCKSLDNTAKAVPLMP